MGILNGKTAFVTGGAGGIGAATAKEFAAEGAKVAVADLAAANDTVAAITAAGGEAYSVILDVTDPVAVNKALDELVDRWGVLDVAFNNAGVNLETMQTSLADLDLATYDRVIEVNQRAIAIGMGAELRHMLRQGYGAIVNTASIAGLRGSPGPAYTASKHAVVGLTRATALRHAIDGIRVNCVCPAVILTPMTDSAAQDPETLAHIERMHPMGRMGRPEEMATAVAFLASDKASFITGHALAVDGGYLA